MTDTRYKNIALVLTLAGVLFSGYLSAVKFFTSTCALNEPCPYFLGHPTCWYGFGLFLVLFVLTLVSFGKTAALRSIVKANLWISGLGILFSGYFTIPEISHLLSGTVYSLGLPTCAYGLVFYVIIFILSISYLKNSN